MSIIKTRIKKLSALVIVSSVSLSLLMTGCSSDVKETEGSVISYESETTEETVAPTLTPTPTPEPTSTPTPTPVPTPVPEYVEPTMEETWYNGFVDPRSVRAEIITNYDDITCVVNKYYALPLDYVPDDLVDCEHSMNQQLRACANDAWNLMYEACLEDTGRQLFLWSGFRDANLQNYLFYRSANARGTAFACKRNAYQGRSEHQLGLALDLTPAGADSISDDFGSTTVGMWVNEHCHEYGFIRRYQEAYINETGYDQEAWHYRYVGVELATYLYENDMSLEAYWGMEQILPWDE